MPTETMRYLTGSMMLPRSTGLWRMDPDGGWWDEHTPYQKLDMAGTVVEETPYEPFVRLMGGPAYGMELVRMGYRVRREDLVLAAQAVQKARPWWRFWR